MTKLPIIVPSALLLSAALTACAPEPVKPETLLATPVAPTIGMANQFGLPSDLDGAVRQAQIQRKNGDLDGATATLSQLVIVAPDDPRVLGEYGKTLVSKGQTEDALAFLKRAIELQPSDWMLFSAEGVAYDQKGDYASAYAAYQKALVLKPGEPTVLSNAGLSRMQAGDIETADLLLTQAAQQLNNTSDYPRIAKNLELVRSLHERPGGVVVTFPGLERGNLAPLPPDESAFAPAEAPALAAVPVAPVAQTSAVSPAPALSPMQANAPAEPAPTQNKSFFSGLLPTFKTGSESAVVRPVPEAPPQQSEPTGIVPPAQQIERSPIPAPVAADAPREIAPVEVQQSAAAPTPAPQPQNLVVMGTPIPDKPVKPAPKPAKPTQAATPAKSVAPAAEPVVTAENAKPTQAPKQTAQTAANDAPAIRLRPAQ